MRLETALYWKYREISNYATYLNPEPGITAMVQDFSKEIMTRVTKVAETISEEQFKPQNNFPKFTRSEICDLLGWPQILIPVLYIRMGKRPETYDLYRIESPSVGEGLSFIQDAKYTVPELVMVSTIAVGDLDTLDQIWADEVEKWRKEITDSTEFVSLVVQAAAKAHSLLGR
jgi:hypothetical protein